MSKDMGNKIAKDDKIKKENKKAGRKFVLIMVVSGLIGAVIGGLSSMDFSEGWEEPQNLLADFLYTTAPWAVIVCNMAMIIVGTLYYRKGKKLYFACRDKVEEEAEEEYEQIDAIFSKGMIFINMSMVVSYGLFACFAVNLIKYVEVSGPKMFIVLCMVLIAFIGGVFGSIKLSQLYVDLMRVMNPRLSGSVYDSKFHEKWEDSCDEYEKMMIYKSAYRAFMTTNKVCSFCWVVSMILGMFYEINALPAVMVTIIWGAMTLSYYKEAYRLEHGKVRK